MEEDFILFKKIKEQPIKKCEDLSENMIGKRSGFIYFTESFRIDFAKKMSKLEKFQEELEYQTKISHYLQSKLDQADADNLKKDEIIDEMAEELKREYISYEPCYLADAIGCPGIKCTECIKQYFYKKLEKRTML